MTSLYIAFCEANKSVATDIEQKLKKASISFTPLSSDLALEEKGLTFLIAETKLPGILLLSDNFLKSEICMKNMLGFVQNSAVAENMKIVVIDGQYASGAVDTTFDRVSNVIKYMNYWQEKYLEMRKQKRTIDPSQEEAFNEKLLNVKNISSEIGDFLRVVRGKDFWTYEQMVFNDFEIFFKKFGSVGQHLAYTKVAEKNIAVTQNPPVDSKSSVNATPALLSEKEKSTPEIPAPKPVTISAKPVTLTENKAKAPNLPTESPKKGEENEETKVLLESIKNTPEINTSNTSKPITLHEKLAAQLRQDKSIPASEVEEELIIAEVLQEVEEIKMKHSSNQLEEKSISVPASPPEILDHVFTTKEQDAEIKEEPEIEKDVAKIADLNEDKIMEEEEFDIMDGLEIEDITDEFEEEYDEEYEENYEDEVIEEPNTDGDYFSLEDVFKKEKNEEDLKDSVKAFETNKKRTEVSFTAAMNSAKAYMMSGAHREGMKAFETLMEDYPDNVEVRYHYAQNLREEVNDQESATAHFEKIIKLDPNHYPSYTALAEIAEQNNDFLLAKSYYEKVVNLKPEEPGVYYKLGLITAGFYAEKPKLAIKYFKKALIQNPKNEDAYYRLAVLLSEGLGKDKKALVNYLKTLEINPKHPFANYDLALLYYKMGDKKNAAKYYEKAWHINTELKTKENDIAFHYEEPEENTSALQPTQDQSLFPLIDNDKVILITGATSGIGRATAAKFAAHGFRLILTGRREDRLEKLKTEFEATNNTKVKTLHFDVRNLEDVKSMISNLEEEWKIIDVLINNAGLAKGYAPIHEGDIEHWDTMIDTNIKGLLYLTRAVTPHMVARKSGHIINICSSAGKEVYPNGNVYCATKHAVDALTQAMRLDLYKHNIRVGQVSPSHVEETEFAFVRYEDAEKAKIYEDFQPLKSSDVADAIFYMVNTPDYVNINDIVLSGKQQANNTNIDRSGREEKKSR